MADIQLTATANTEVMHAQIRQWFEDAQGVIALQIKEDLNDVLQDIKDKWVPYRTGALRDTGKVLPVVIDARGNISSGIEFGSDDVLYARIQHENLMYNHPFGRSAKYIEIPLRAYAARRAGEN